LKNKQVVDEAELLELKADELVALLQKGLIAPKRIKAMQQKINNA
jgi:hypothetical protein